MPEYVIYKNSYISPDADCPYRIQRYGTRVSSCPDYITTIEPTISEAYYSEQSYCSYAYACVLPEYKAVKVGWYTEIHKLEIYPSSKLEDKPNPFFIIKECGRSIQQGLTPNQVCDDMLNYSLVGYIDRKWLLNAIVKIKLNWFKSNIVVGVGVDFPFEFTSHIDDT